MCRMLRSHKNIWQFDYLLYIFLESAIIRAQAVLEKQRRRGKTVQRLCVRGNRFRTDLSDVSLLDLHTLHKMGYGASINPWKFGVSLMKAWLKTAFFLTPTRIPFKITLRLSCSVSRRWPSKVNVTLEQHCETNCSQTLHWLTAAYPTFVLMMRKCAEN